MEMVVSPRMSSSYGYHLTNPFGLRTNVWTSYTCVSEASIVVCAFPFERMTRNAWIPFHEPPTSAKDDEHPLYPTFFL
ncbi:hypothetical protein PsorP6_015184 [Peronosclerospora sorghi]|uniref:Uncharacterized protein n=1 Tax=Peronosclerospora sorghi TaxID=230839 RepID=A0ACC0VVQ7_9STRA|nr:hypothetical protein PsorP6_015184 [Peronosclerospora sorghi]